MCDEYKHRNHILYTRNMKRKQCQQWLNMYSLQINFFIIFHDYKIKIKKFSPKEYRYKIFTKRCLCKNITPCRLKGCKIILHYLYPTKIKYN